MGITHCELSTRDRCDAKKIGRQRAAMQGVVAGSVSRSLVGRGGVAKQGFSDRGARDAVGNRRINEAEFESN